MIPVYFPSSVFYNRRYITQHNPTFTYITQNTAEDNSCLSGPSRCNTRTLLANVAVRILSYYRASKHWMRAHIVFHNEMRDQVCLPTWHAFVKGENERSSQRVHDVTSQKQIRCLIFGIRCVSHFRPSRVVSTLHTGTRPGRDAVQSNKQQVYGVCALNILVLHLHADLHTA